MKKSILIAILALTTIVAKAQKDYCKDIIKRVKELQGITTYSTPIKVFSRNTIYAQRTIKNGKISLDDLAFSYQAAVSDFSIKGVYIKLADGTLIKDENATADCSLDYFYAGVIKLDDETEEKLAKSPIIEFSIGNNEARKVDQKFALKLMNYITCVFSDQNK